MKKKLYVILLSVFLLFSFTKESSKKIEAKLADIQYYSVNKCNSGDYIYVMVLYEVKYKDITDLKMKHEFDGNISTSSRVNEIDKKGNIVYGFCLKKDEDKTFTTKFISKKGKESNEVIVNINFLDAEIISGTPPQTINK